MPYNKGTFYHEAGKDGQIIKFDSAIMFGSKVVPTAAIVAPAGSLCLCTADGSIGLYINEGTEEAPDWKKVSIAEA